MNRVKNNDTISIAKAVGIILVVIGHSGCPDILSKFIYLFHMPLFFIASGFFFKEENLVEWRKFVVRRIKGIWYPFEKWGLSFLWLHNVLFLIGLHSHYYELKTIVINTITCMTLMIGTDYLTSGVWFLRDLFLGSIILLFVSKIFYSWMKISFRMSMTISCFILLVLYVIFDQLNICINFKWIIFLEKRTLYSTSFIAIGLIFKTLINNISRQSIKRASWGVILCFTIEIFATYNFPKIDINVSSEWLWAGILLAMVGFIMVLRFSQLLKKTILSKELVWIGNNSIIIFFLHTICYKPISLVIIKIYNLPFSNLIERVIIKDNWWIIYSLSGIVLPVIVYKLWLKYITPIINVDKLLWK